jgi:hypothetical protein
MLARLEQWIDQTNFDYRQNRICCEHLHDEFNGFYPLSFLQETFYVVVDVIPKPDFPELRAIGLGDFIDMPVDGITYKNTYFVLPQFAQNLRLHFHELVHVAQWSHLGAETFITNYINEIQTYGYDYAPLETMAKNADTHFTNNGFDKFNVPDYVAAILK